MSENENENEVHIDQTPPWLVAKADQELARLVHESNIPFELASSMNLAIVQPLDPAVPTEDGHLHPCAKCGAGLQCDDVPYEADVSRQHESGVVVLFLVVLCHSCGDEIVASS